MHPDTLVYVNNLAVLLQNQNKLDEVGPISGHCIRGIWKMSSDYVHFALVESCRFMVRKLPAAKLICQQQHRPVISFLPIKGHGKRCVFITGWPPIPLSRGWYMSCFRDLFYITFTRPCWILLFFYHIYKYIIIRIRVYIYICIHPQELGDVQHQAVYQALFSVASRRKGSFAEHWKELKHSLEQPIRAPFSQWPIWQLSLKSRTSWMRPNQFLDLIQIEIDRMRQCMLHIYIYTHRDSKC